MVSLISSPVGWSEQIGDDKEEQLWHVKYVEELSSIPNIKPHPISI